MKQRAHLSLIASGGFVFAAAAHAAGGHFDVDDAAVLEPGHCQYETWVTRAPSASATAFHFGPGCRVGPVELALNYDRLMTASGSVDALGPQLKWVVTDPLASPLSFGAA